MISDSNSWSVSISSDVELNFLVYVARVYGLCNGYFSENTSWPDRQVVLSDQLHRDLETQWHDLWNRSILQKAESKAQQKAESSSRLMHQTKSEQNHHVSPFVLEPPHFEATEQQELRKVFVEQWASFIYWWNMPAGGQVAMYYWEAKPDIIRYVREFEIEAGRAIHAFHLNVELIYNGPHEPIEVTDEYVIIPVRADYLLKKDWWNERFKERS